MPGRNLPITGSHWHSELIIQLSRSRLSAAFTYLSLAKAKTENWIIIRSKGSASNRLSPPTPSAQPLLSLRKNKRGRSPPACWLILLFSTATSRPYLPPKSSTPRCCGLLLVVKRCTNLTKKGPPRQRCPIFQDQQAAGKFNSYAELKDRSSTATPRSVVS